MFAIASFATGCPIGPASALLSTQTIVVVIFSAIATATFPNWMQVVGLIFGLFGAMLLTIPKELYALYYRLTRCEKYIEPAKPMSKTDPNF